MERRKAPNAMKHIRIGKDISIRWEINTDGAAIPLEGRDLTLEMKSPIGAVSTLPYRVDGNVLTMTYYGYEQNVVGEYSLTLWENKGKPGQNVVDAIRAFKLVRTSPEEADFAGGDLQVESVDLGTANLEILSGGGASTPGGSPDLSALEGKVAANTASITKINEELDTVKEEQTEQNNRIANINTTLEEHSERISQLESSTPGGDSDAIAQINSTLQGINTEQTEQNNRLNNHEERLVYTESDLLKVREEYNSIISELVKSIAHTQKAFVVETNDSEGHIFIDNVYKTIPANTIKAFRFEKSFKSYERDPGIASFRFLVTDTSTVTDMSYMFRQCTDLKTLDITSFDTSAVTNMAVMFSGCSSLSHLDVTKLDTHAVTDMNGMFYGCSALTSIDLSNFDTHAVRDMNYMFGSCSALTHLDLSNFDTSAVTNMANMFSFCSALTSLDLSNFDTSAVTNMAYMFIGCASLASMDLSHLVTSKVTEMIEMFNSCTSLTSIEVSNFDTSVVTNMKYMFNSCSALTSIDLSNFDTHAVANMNGMFRYCSALTSIDVTNFDTSAVTNIGLMFSGCSALTSLDLSSFDTTEVTNMDSIFWGCSSLTSLLLGTNFFKTAAVTIIDFSSCYKWTNETVVTSLVTNSYDRAAAGLNTLTIKLHANTKAALSDEQKASITNKGYTIA